MGRGQVTDLWHQMEIRLRSRGEIAANLLCTLAPGAMGKYAPSFFSSTADAATTSRATFAWVRVRVGVGEGVIVNLARSWRDRGEVVARSSRDPDHGESTASLMLSVATAWYSRKLQLTPVAQLGRAGLVLSCRG